MSHSLSDTSFNSRGLVPSSLLFCNYIALQHICILAHAHTHTLTHSQTNTQIFIPFCICSQTYMRLHICINIPHTRSNRQRQPHQIISQLYEGQRQRWSEGRSAKQSEKHQRQEQQQHPLQHSSFLFPCLPQLGFVSEQFVRVHVCVARCKEESQRARRYPGHCLVLMWSC